MSRSRRTRIVNKARPAGLTVATGPDALSQSHGFRIDQERRLLAIRRKRRSEAGEAEQSRNEAERSGAKRSAAEVATRRFSLIGFRRKRRQRVRRTGALAHQLAFQPVRCDWANKHGDDRPEWRTPRPTRRDRCALDEVGGPQTERRARSSALARRRRVSSSEQARRGRGSNGAEREDDVGRRSAVWPERRTLRTTTRSVRARHGRRR